MSTDPLRAAGRALAYWERRQEVGSNNLANVETAGYKRQRVFGELLEQFGPVAAVTDDMSAGTIRDTGRPLDVAFQGEGFLVVETEAGEMLRRGGSLSLDAAGVLVDPSGRPVLGQDGVIVLPPGEITVQRNGVVQVGGEEVARLRVERAAVETLDRVEAGLWVSDAREAMPEEGLMLRQGALEESNVGALEGLVDMLDVQRNYAAVQKSVVTLDEVLETVANRIGRVG